MNDGAAVFVKCPSNLLSCLLAIGARGVRNPFKISVFGFQKTKRTSNFENREVGFRGLV